MPRGRIPFARRRGPGVNVGPAFRNDTEFERGADRNVAAGPDRRLEIIDRCLGEMRLRSYGSDLRSARARANGLASVSFVEPGALTNDATVQSPGSRGVYHPKARHSALDEPDV